MLNMNQKYTKFVKYFNYLVKKTLFKHKNKTNNIFTTKLQISNFNKYIVALVSLLFFYIFYLSIPTIYDKSWVQNTIEEKLLEEFKLNFSTSSKVSYDILPSPHFKIENVKIFDDNLDAPKELAEIKQLKIFITQNNFFNKKNINIKEILLENANFSFNKKNLKFLDKFVNSKFSQKKIKVIKSSIFYKNNNNEILAIIKLPKGTMFYNVSKNLNLLDLKGKVFNIPFDFELKKDFIVLESKETSFISKKINLDILNKSYKKSNESISGTNVMSILDLKLNTDYTSAKKIVIFESKKSKMNNSNIYYNGKFSIEPFDLKLDIKIDDFNLSELLSTESIFFEFIQSNMLFNENISASISITGLSDKENLLSSSALVFNLNNGTINFDKTKFINDKIGSLEVISSNLVSEDGRLFLISEVKIDIQNSDNLYRFIQTPKNFRKKINNISVNFSYDFLSEETDFESIKVDGSEVSEKIYSLVKSFSRTKEINFNKSRRFLNNLFTSYEG